MSEIDRFTGKRYCEMRPLTKSRFGLVMVVLEDDGSAPLNESDAQEAADLARLAVLTMSRDAGHRLMEEL